MANSVRNILITGATGGLGLSLTETFCMAGYRVTATGRNPLAGKRLESYGAKFVSADLLEKGRITQLCEGQESIIHAAALSSAGGKPDNFERINVKATATLLDAAQRAGCQRFVYISSPSIYASLRDQFDITEYVPPAAQPLNDYARTKRDAERLVLAANGTDFHTTAIRPRAIVGPDDQVLLPKMLEMLERGIIPFLRQGKALVELTDVRDVARAVLLAEQRINAVTGLAVNISGGHPVAMREFAQKLAETAGKPVRFLPIPIKLAVTLAGIGEWRSRLCGYRYEPRLTRYILSTMAYSTTFDLSFAKERLGYEPVHDAFATLLAETRARSK